MPLDFELQADRQIVTKIILGGKKHKDFDETVKIANDLKIFIEFTEEQKQALLQKWHPDEPKKITDSRVSISENVIKPHIQKVLGTIQKIHTSSKYSVEFKGLEGVSESIRTDWIEFITKRYHPTFKSLEQWFWQLGFMWSLVDPNAIVAVLPRDIFTGEPLEDTDFREPLVYIYESKNVWHFSDQFVLVEVPETDGKVFIIITDTEVWRAVKRKDEDAVVDFALMDIHDFGEAPAFRMGGLSVSSDISVDLWKSFICGVVPPWRSALRSNSDIEGALKEHIYLEKWEIRDNNCKACKGKGFQHRKVGLQTSNSGVSEVRCGVCNGMGYIRPKGNYSVHTIKTPDSLKGEKITDKIPPAGYIEKPLDIVELTIERVKEQIIEGLKAVNMEFLFDTPLNQSGKAKEVDRNELNGFLRTVAHHFKQKIQLPAYFWNARWRYKNTLTTMEQFKSLMPSVVIPDSFEVFTEALLTQQIQKARDAGMDKAYINSLENELIAQTFKGNDFEKRRQFCINELDPYPNFASEEISIGLANRTITQKNAIIHNNIIQFVNEAIDESKGAFLDLDFAAKAAVIDTKAEAMLQELNVSRGTVTVDISGS